MKILVYGVGAIGSLTVHFLCRAGNDVTVVARSTYETLKENGLAVVHRIQNKTTVDRPKVVKQADLNEKYDIVFSVIGEMQYLDAWFEKYRAEHSGTPMPTWDRLRKQAVSEWRKRDKC